jgi:Nuclease-related domain
MRLTVLSDRPAEQLAAIRQDREARQASLDEQYRQSLAVRARYIDEARRERDLARAGVRLLGWARWSLVLRRRRREPVPQRVELTASADEEKARAGVEGERRAREALAPLGGSWALFQGYNHRRGEIDLLLLGPGGLYAVEVKNVNGTFRVTRDRWSYVRNGRSGQPRHDELERVLTDDGGRPPGIQLTEPLLDLEEFLASRGQPASFRPVVLLNHHRARVRYQAGDVGVDVLTSGERLLAMARDGEGGPGAARLAAIGELIEHRHKEYERRRQGGTRPPGSGPRPAGR